MSSRALADRISAHPVVYDSIQRLAGRDAVARRMQPWLSRLRGRVLDVGGGTGRTRQLLDSRARYLCVDMERDKLTQVRRASNGSAAIVGNGLSLPIADASVDAVLLIAVIHHLEPDVTGRMLDEISRVLQPEGEVVVLDAVRSPRMLSRAMWALDRGSYPRSGEELDALMAAWFDVDAVQAFAVIHEYRAFRCRKRKQAQ